jgi:hypothetical protein
VIVVFSIDVVMRVTFVMIHTVIIAEFGDLGNDLKMKKTCIFLNCKC